MPASSSLELVVPDEYRAQSVVFGHRSFVNAVITPGSPGKVVTIANLYQLPDIDSTRQMHDVTNPFDRASAFAAGLKRGSPFTLSCWLSRTDPSHSRVKEEGLLYAYDNGIRRRYVIGIGSYRYRQIGPNLPVLHFPAVLLACDADVHGWRMMAAGNDLTRFIVRLQPSGDIERIEKTDAELLTAYQSAGAA